MSAGYSATGHSLRGRLLWSMLVSILLVAVLQAFSAYRGALRQADAMFDDHLQQMAHSLRAGTFPGEPLEQEFPGLDFNVYVQIWGPDGTQLFRSARSGLPPRAVLGFSDVEADGNRYRVYSLQTATQTVQLAQDLGARTRKAQALAAQALLPFALLTPLLLLAVWWVIDRTLAPLERARRQLAQRAADDFSPLSGEHLPDEVRPLVDELNLLFSRVKDAFATQKDFVADAAHELRSPLTALRLQAQALRNPEASPEMRASGITRLNEGIDRAIRLVEQLLILAREEAGAGNLTSANERVDLKQVIRLAVSDVHPQAILKQIDIGYAGDPSPEAFLVAGSPDALRMLLGNLLDNAVKYTPRLGRVDITLAMQAGTEGKVAQCVLTVEDSGPGIALPDRGRVFDRFYRAGNGSLEPGSGLGLAIVSILASRHGASVTLGESLRLGGLMVRVGMARAGI